MLSMKLNKGIWQFFLLFLQFLSRKLFFKKEYVRTKRNGMQIVLSRHGQWGTKI